MSCEWPSIGKPEIDTRPSLTGSRDDPRAGLPTNRDGSYCNRNRIIKKRLEEIQARSDCGQEVPWKLQLHPEVFADHIMTAPHRAGLFIPELPLLQRSSTVNLSSLSLQSPSIELIHHVRVPQYPARFHHQGT